MVLLTPWDMLSNNQLHKEPGLKTYAASLVLQASNFSLTSYCITCSHTDDDLHINGDMRANTLKLVHTINAYLKLQIS